MTQIKEKTPIAIFSDWLQEAHDCKSIADATAMCLATATASGMPSARMVLLKDYGEDGFTFYTNLESRKGDELKENPNVALCFYWQRLGKQVRIEGVVQQVANEEADKYFDSRSLKSRVGAIVSKQSQPLDDYQTLVKDVTKTMTGAMIGKIKRPEYWSGYRVIPHIIEFWSSGEARLHNRIIYKRENESDDWQSQRLYP